MAVAKLSREQEAFLEECALEFSDRFTDADLEYKKIYEMGVPQPPIMCPWYGRTRFNRDRGDGRHNDRRDHRSDNNDRSTEHRRDHRSDNYRDRNSHFKERRFRPYN